MVSAAGMVLGRSIAAIAGGKLMCLCRTCRSKQMSQQICFLICLLQRVLKTHEQAFHTYRTGTPAGKEPGRGCLHLGELNYLHHLLQII